MLRHESSEINFSSSPGQDVPESHITLNFYASLSDLSAIYQDLPENGIDQITFKNIIGNLIGADPLPVLVATTPFGPNPIKFFMSSLKKKESTCKKENSAIEYSRDIVIRKIK